MNTTNQTHFTPGPLAVLPTTEAREIPWRIVADCGTHSVITSYSNPPVEREYGEANAALFSLAPQLVEALRGLCEAVKEHNSRQSSLGDCIIEPLCTAQDVLARLEAGR